MNAFDHAIRLQQEQLVGVIKTHDRAIISRPGDHLPITRQTRQDTPQQPVFARD